MLTFEDCLAFSEQEGIAADIAEIPTIEAFRMIAGSFSPSDIAARMESDGSGGG